MATATEKYNQERLNRLQKIVDAKGGLSEDQFGTGTTDKLAEYRGFIRSGMQPTTPKKKKKDEEEEMKKYIGYK